jgi:hypothetical protein
LSVNGKFVRDIPIAAAVGGPLAYWVITQNVTRWTEGRLASRIQLLFSYGGAGGSAMIPMLEEADGCRPVLIQPWSWRYARAATLYFALAWTSILVAALLILANLGIQNSLFRFYAVLGTCATWVATLLGIPDLLRIPVRQWIRGLFASTRPHTVGIAGKRSREITLVCMAAWTGWTGTGLEQRGRSMRLSARNAPFSPSFRS